jgi:putative FmdB family regulatory protein
MALYEYHCKACGTRTEKRMPMSEVSANIPCPKCGKQASKMIGQFAVVGRAESSLGDGPAPWDSDGGDDDFGMGDMGMGDHGHSHGPGGHTH